MSTPLTGELAKQGLRHSNIVQSIHPIRVCFKRAVEICELRTPDNEQSKYGFLFIYVSPNDNHCLYTPKMLSVRCHLCGRVGMLQIKIVLTTSRVMISKQARMLTRWYKKSRSSRFSSIDIRGTC